MPHQRKKLQSEVDAIKRRLVDDVLRVREYSSLFASGSREPAVAREWERRIALRFGQLIERTNKFQNAIHESPIEWARRIVVGVLQPLSEFPELLPLLDRISDEESLRGPKEPERIPMRVGKPKKLTKRQQALVALAELWRDNREASYKEIGEYADKSKVPTPWHDCPTWDVAAAKRESACKTLCAKARAMSKRIRTLT
jgi:hypothetical protein